MAKKVASTGDLARRHPVTVDLAAGYAAMAADEAREREAEEWVECLITDVSEEPDQCCK